MIPFVESLVFCIGLSKKWDYHLNFQLNKNGLSYIINTKYFFENKVDLGI